MRTLFAMLTALMLTTLAPIVHADEGPFGGAIYQDEEIVHVFDNTSDFCVSVWATFEVLMYYEPTSDTITLSAEGETDVGFDGKAFLKFEGPSCHKFEIFVQGTKIESVAEYIVTVEIF